MWSACRNNKKCGTIFDGMLEILTRAFLRSTHTFAPFVRISWHFALMRVWVVSHGSKIIRLQHLFITYKSVSRIRAKNGMTFLSCLSQFSSGSILSFFRALSLSSSWGAVIYLNLFSFSTLSMCFSSFFFSVCVCVRSSLRSSDIEAFIVADVPEA